MLKPQRFFFLLLSAFLISFLISIFIFRKYSIIGNVVTVKRAADVTGLENQKRKINTTSLFIAGDVMLGRSVMIESFKLNDKIYPFRKVAAKMRNSDIAFVNLESPVTDSCPFIDSGYVFCADSSMLEGLSYSGVDVVSLANNHILNYGNSGREQTVKHLEEVNILATGLGNLVKIERNGVIFGFLGFDKSQEVSPKLTQDEIDLITVSDKEVDILVIAMHWGVEYQNKALPGVKNLAREIVGYGADVIVGHHPHWVQDWEFIDGKPVFYSLGNFVFDQMWSEETKKGLAVELVYNKKGTVIDKFFLPTYMFSSSQPEFVEN